MRVKRKRTVRISFAGCEIKTKFASLLIVPQLAGCGNANNTNFIQLALHPASRNVWNVGCGVPIIFVWFVSPHTPHPAKCRIAGCKAN